MNVREEVGGLPRRVLLAAPRGFCAGVERALEIVDRVLHAVGPPVYVRRELVHNRRVITGLEERGVRFVDSETDVPPGAVCILAAHGVAPEVRRRAGQRDLRVVDATCPLVERVHRGARRAAAEGRTILLIGHAEHDEVVGTRGEATEQIHVVTSAADVERLPFSANTPVTFLTQTTLAVDETAEVVDAIRERFGDVTGPARDDICYAVENRQAAVKALAGAADVVLVVGARNSSNAARLVEVARGAGMPSHLVPEVDGVDPAWVARADAVGLTAAASTPDVQVQEVLDHLVDLGFTTVEEVRVARERVAFPLPEPLWRTGEETTARLT